MFGAPVEQIGDNPPWVRHDAAEISLQQITETDPADFSKAGSPRVAKTMEFYRERWPRAPELARLVRVVLPDLQGPSTTSS